MDEESKIKFIMQNCNCCHDEAKANLTTYNGDTMQVLRYMHNLEKKPLPPRSENQERYSLIRKLLSKE